MTKIKNYLGEDIEETLEELLDEVVVSITKEYPEAQIILFGSYARGDYTENSDLDFCVLVPEIIGRRMDMSVDISCTIRRGFPLPKDVLLYTYDEFEEYAKSPSRLQYTIKEEGRFLNAQ